MRDDGKVIIGTELDTKDLEKELKYAQKQLEKYEKEAEKLTEKKAKIEFENEPLKEASEKYEGLLKKVEEYKNTLRSLKKESQNIGTFDPEFGYYDMQKDKYRRLIAETNAEIEKGANSYTKVSTQLSKNQYQLDGINKKLKSNAVQQEILKNKVEETTQEYENQSQFTMPNISKGISKIIGKVGKWALAVFSIRSAYMLIRQAMSTLAAEDETLSANVEYLRWVLAQTLKPIVEWFIQAVYGILVIVNEITMQLFKWNIFTGKSVEDFNNAKKKTKGMVGDLKEARKQLAGFDEMNILSDNVKASGSDYVGPNLPDPEDWKKNAKEAVENWAKGFLEQHDKISQIRESMSIEDWFDKFGNFGLFMKGIVDLIYGIDEYLMGAFYQLEGSFTFLTGVFTGNEELIEQGWQMMCDGLALTFDGIMWTIIGLFEGLVGGITGLIVWLLGKIFGETETTNADMEENFSHTGAGIKDSLEVNGDEIQNHLSGNSSTVKKNVLGDADEIGKELGRKLEKFVYEDVPKFIAQLLLKGKEFYTKIKYFFEYTLPSFIKGVINGIVYKFGELGGKVGEAISGAFKRAINGVLDTAEYILNKPINTINRLIDTVNTLPGVNIGRLGTISLPRLAKGGIINMPGRGIPVGSAIGGERGAEGVIPLTDSQQMDLLGEAIGKHIVINATVPVYVGNRQVAREMKRIEAENDFAFNR